MNYDYYSILSSSDSKPRKPDEFTVKYHLIAKGKKDDANSLRADWQKNNVFQPNTDEKLSKAISEPDIDISVFPEYSFLIQFRFILEKPYISRDEQDFYIIDNPIRKDRVFGLPYVAPTSWKGSLRAALWQNGYKGDNACINRIFGNERGVEKQSELRAGRLHLFPTFFGKIDLEIINPHDRERRVGKNPILMECVPIDTSGLFTLLYVPYDLTGKDTELAKKQISEDVKLLATGLKTMFRDTGFGAKTSSGYGQAKNAIADGNIVLKAKGIENTSGNQPSSEPPEESFKKYLTNKGIVKDEFKGSGDAGLLSNPEYHEKNQQSGSGSFSEFKRFRRWYDQNGEKWQKELRLKNTSTGWPTWSFDSFDTLLKVTEKIEPREGLQ
jgi:CRISPR-associated protein Cmr2